MSKIIATTTLLSLLCINLPSEAKINFKIGSDLNYFMKNTLEEKTYSLNESCNYNLTYVLTNDSLFILNTETINKYIENNFNVSIQPYYDIYSNITSNEFLSIKYNATYNGSKIKVDFVKHLDTERLKK